MELFNLIRNTPIWYQLWFWLTVASGTLLIFVRFTILQDRGVPHAGNDTDRAQQTVNIQGSSIGGDVVLGDKSATSQVSDEALVRRQRVGVKIRRAFEDFSSHLSTFLEQHRKDIDNVAQRHNFYNTYSSGPHLREQHELARKKRREISSAWLELKRKVEDELLESGQTELPDGELKNQYTLAEEAKGQAQEEVLEATHNYFVSRSATFSVPDLEKLKQAILNDEPL